VILVGLKYSLSLVEGRSVALTPFNEKSYPAPVKLIVLRVYADLLYPHEINPVPLAIEFFGFWRLGKSLEKSFATNEDLIWALYSVK
jgi:hypothetical protein